MAPRHQCSAVRPSADSVCPKCGAAAPVGAAEESLQKSPDPLAPNHIGRLHKQGPDYRAIADRDLEDKFTRTAAFRLGFMVGGSLVILIAVAALAKELASPSLSANQVAWNGFLTLVTIPPIGLFFGMFFISVATLFPLVAELLFGVSRRVRRFISRWEKDACTSTHPRGTSLDAAIRTDLPDRPPQSIVSKLADD